MKKTDTLLRHHLTVAALACTLLLIPSLTPGKESGGKIAFYSARSGRDDLYLMNADGSNVVRLTNGPYGGKCPDLSADGREVVFVGTRDGNSELYLLDIATGTEKRLTDLPGTERHPKWSPDGKRIALQSDRDGQVDLYVMDADGGNWLRLTSTEAEELWPNWSPDGSKIAFSSNQDGNWELYVVNADGSGLRRITDSEDGELHPSWSPDGTRFVYQRLPRGGRFENDVQVMNVDGTDDHKLTSFDGVEENPVWSPDGRQIAFQSMKDGNFEIYAMDADGTNMKNLTNNPAPDYWPSWVGGTASSTESQGSGKLPANAVELQILFDNISRLDGVTAGWGFSCLVKAGDKTLLMDAGANGEVLMSNMAVCGVDPSKIETVLISHCHADHLDGLATVLRASGKATKVYLPGKDLLQKVSGPTLAKVDSARSLVSDVAFVDDPTLISPGVMTMGLIAGTFPEQSLLIMTQAGPVVVTGCAHPGIARIVNKAVELAGEKILLVVGGFHLVQESAENLDRLAAELDSLVCYIAPCHCSGDLAKERFRARFGDRCLDLGAGSVLKIADLTIEGRNRN